MGACECACVRSSKAKVSVCKAPVSSTNTGIELQAVDQVGDHHIFGAQTGGLRDGRKLGRSALQQGLCFEQFGGKVGAGFGV